MLKAATFGDITEFENKSCLYSRVLGDFVLSERLDFSDGAQFLTDGKALLAEIKNGAMIKIGEAEDSEEFESFVSFFAPNTVMSECENGDIIVMKKKAVGEPKKISIAYDFKLKDFHALFLANGLSSDKEGFMLGMSDSVKTKTGFLIGKYDEEKKELEGGLCVTGITDKTAIVTAVAVGEKYRRTGVGTFLFEEAFQMLSGRDIFVYRERGKNKEFYESLGFTETGSIVTEAL